MMTTATIALDEVTEKGTDIDVLRQMVQFIGFVRGFEHDPQGTTRPICPFARRHLVDACLNPVCAAGYGARLSHPRSKQFRALGR